MPNCGRKREKHCRACAALLEEDLAEAIKALGVFT
jgi:hypothetical protein